MTCSLYDTVPSLLPVHLKKRVVVTYKPRVDEQHSEVQQLIGAGYTNDMSIKAIERWETASEAMGHLLAGPESDGVFGSTAPMEAKEGRQTEKFVNLLCYLRL